MTAAVRPSADPPVATPSSGATAPHGRGAGFAALAAAGLIWGTSFVFGKWALEQLSVAHMILWRFLFASIILGVVYWRDHARAPRPLSRGDLALALVAGVVGVPIQYLVQFEGLARTTVSHASLMVGLVPVFLAIAATLFAHERLDLVGWLWLGASTIGAGLVALGGGDSPNGAGPSLVGDGLVIASLFAGVAWVLLSQRLMRRQSPAATSALVFILGTAVLAVFVLATDGLPAVHGLSVRTWLSVAAMGVLGTSAATLLWNWGLARVQASQAGVFVNLEPVVGAVCGVWLFGDRFGALSLAGAVLIVMASVAVSMRKQS